MSDELVRRIDAAIDMAVVRRSEIYLALPECHKNKCRGHHPDGSEALGMMKRQIRDSIHSELLYRTTTRPDLGMPDRLDTAAITLAHLLRTYNVHDAGTFIRAAEMLIDAYPAIGEAILQEVAS